MYYETADRMYYKPNLPMRTPRGNYTYKQAKEYAKPGSKYNVVLPNGLKQEWEVVYWGGRSFVTVDIRQHHNTRLWPHDIPNQREIHLDQFMALVATDPMTSIVFEKSSIFSPEIMTKISKMNQRRSRKKRSRRKRSGSRSRRKSYRGRRRRTVIK